jgi:Swt1-like HEPN
MLEAYDLLFNLETQLREYIVEVMTRKYGARWIRQRISGDMKQQWADKKEIAVSKGEDELPLIWYADFSDYIQIIIRKDNWNELFESIFFNAIDIQASFQRLQPLRICTMHARPISREDLLLITVETHRILRAIGKLKSSA